MGAAWEVQPLNDAEDRQHTGARGEEVEGAEDRRRPDQQAVLPQMAHALADHPPPAGPRPGRLGPRRPQRGEQQQDAERERDAVEDERRRRGERGQHTAQRLADTAPGHHLHRLQPTVDVVSRWT
ncbi:hypothetical protein AB0I16_23885 [Streptomyces sp. NPDC050703]|uniref:hypothetical protein n=1 Tax=Streptomyces sp. NPDC050703 TaxID=3157218 RepID=UPI003435A0DB